MTSFVRSSAIISIALAVTAAGGVGLAASASAASAPSASASATSTTAAPTSAPATAVPTANATAAPTATSGATSATDQDPSLATQNATGNHAMGSTIPAADAATGSTSLTIHSLAKVQATAQAATTSGSSVRGLDVSGYQTSINWKTVAANGAKFAYVKATEGTTYASSSFASQYNGAYSAGLIRGAYHFATPNTSTGAAQATYFVAHGGGWSADGHTLPPLLDIEYGYNATCWGLSQAAMVSWISSFSNTVLSLTGTRPAIYSTTDWWSQCTGNSKSFSANPLMIAHYTSASTPGTLPASWSNWNIWQWADAGTFPGDQDVFNGTAADLKSLALGATLKSIAYQAADTGATLAAGATLQSGQSIESSNRQYTLSMAANGNLQLNGNGRLDWSSKTFGSGNWVTMQTDGNLVVYSSANEPLWATATVGSGGKLIIQSNGDLQVVTSTGTVWRNGAPWSDVLFQGRSLLAGQFLHDSTGDIQAMMQADGNFVIYVGGVAEFQTHTYNHPGAHMILQADGNLVIYNQAGAAIWTTHTRTKASGETFDMQGDGNLVLYLGTKVLWYSHTHL